MFHSFSSKWSFISNVKEKQPFIECLQRLKPISKKVNNKEVKPRKDHQLCTEIFCTERGCIDTFETFEQLNEHILNGIHHIPKVETYDHVKKSFANRLLESSSLHSINISTPTRKVPSNPDSYSDSPFSNQGWALPKRITFRFNQIQKNFLFNLFVDGERTGKKHSPDEVHIAMRQKLSIDLYCSITQIRSLFSRWSLEL